MPRIKWVNAHGLAKNLNVSKHAVQKAIKEGRITAKKVNGNWKINQAKARVEWLENTSPSAAKKSKSNAINTLTKSLDIIENLKAPASQKPEVKISINEAERRDKVAKAQLSELKLAEAMGELVRIDRVTKDAFECARATRNALLNIPARIGPELAAETDPFKVENLLTKALITALEQLATGKFSVKDKDNAEN